MYSILMYCIFGGAFLGGLLAGAYTIYEVLLIKGQMPEKEALEKALKLVAEIEKTELTLVEKKQKLEAIRSGTRERIEEAREAEELLYEFSLRENGINEDHKELLKRNTYLKEQNRVLEMAISAAEGLTTRRR